MRGADWGKVALLLGAGVAALFALAAAGEPQSLWLLRDVLGVAP